MDIEDILDNPAVWILTAVGEGAFFLMLIVLKTMKQQSIMPLWVKIVTILAIPILAIMFSGFAAGD